MMMEISLMESDAIQLAQELFLVIFVQEED